MTQRQRFFLAATAVALAACALAAGPAAAVPTSAPGRAAPPAAAESPEAVAAAYLQARAAAIGAGDPAASLAPWVAPGSQLAARERAVAHGARLHAARLGHLIESVETDVTVGDVAVSDDGESATVAAHVITSVVWHTPALREDVEAYGVDHVLTLTRTPHGWRVSGDEYVDVRVPAFLEEAGAPEAAARAGRRLEQPAGRSLPQPHTGSPRRSASGRSYHAIIPYLRDQAVSYADRYCLSYCPSYVRFGADCANFVSQSARAGDMLLGPGTWDTGWWYDKRGTSSPSDDSYSLSWINVGKQMSFWNDRRTDWVSGISGLGRGDAVYYDWTGDGVWDHVAMVVGTNSAGQKVVDAHTTDYYHVHWKLGYSSTAYKFGRVRAQWVI